MSKSYYEQLRPEIDESRKMYFSYKNEEGCECITPAQIQQIAMDGELSLSKLHDILAVFFPMDVLDMGKLCKQKLFPKGPLNKFLLLLVGVPEATRFLKKNTRSPLDDLSLDELLVILRERNS